MFTRHVPKPPVARLRDRVFEGTPAAGTGLGTHRHMPGTRSCSTCRPILPTGAGSGVGSTRGGSAAPGGGDRVSLLLGRRQRRDQDPAPPAALSGWRGCTMPDASGAAAEVDARRRCRHSGEASQGIGKREQQRAPEVEEHARPEHPTHALVRHGRRIGRRPGSRKRGGPTAPSRGDTALRRNHVPEGQVDPWADRPRGLRHGVLPAGDGGAV